MGIFDGQMPITVCRGRKTTLFMQTHVWM